MTRSARRSRRTRRAIAVAVVAATAALAAAAVPGDLEAIPSIRIIRHQNGTPGSGVVMLHNTTANTIGVDDITFACNSTMTLSPPGTPFTIGPGSSRTVLVICPGSLPLGMQRCTFTARDALGDQLVDFLGVCETAGMPVLTAAPGSHDFGSVQIGTPSTPFTFQLTNTTLIDVTLLHLQLDNPSFLIGLPCNPDATGCDGSNVGPIAGSGAPITVTCNPVKLGMQTAQLHVVDSHGFYLQTPIALTCNGLPAGMPAIQIMPQTVDVGPVEVQVGTAPATVQISNTGSGSLGITSVELVDAGVPGAAGDWSRVLSGACTNVPCSLMTGQTLNAALTFDPSQIGARGATLLVGYNDGSPNTRTVPLDGIGRGATLELVGGPTELDFGVLPLNLSVPLTFALRNTGNRPLTTATVVAMPPVPQLTVTPANPLTVNTGPPTTVTVRCQSATPGMFTTTLRVSAPDVATSAFDIPVECEVRDTLLFSDPTSLQLGEIRTGTGPRNETIRVLSAGAPLALTGAALDTASANLTLTGPTPMTTTATLDLAIDTTADGDLDNTIIVTPANTAIAPISIPITGKVVTASYDAPSDLMLGTFCVGQPTTSGIVALASTGTAAIALPAAPVLTGQPSPFDLALASPTAYPAVLPALAHATVEITPKRRALPGPIDDTLVWSTDVAGRGTFASALHAAFIDAGVAVAPTSLGFAPTPIHIDINNAQQITLRNCDASTIQLGTPDVPPPFSMDSPDPNDFPTQLVAGETTTFRIGFHPTKLGRYEEVLEIASRDLQAPLRITLVGEGVTGDGPGGDDDGNGNPVRSSFYACGGCGTNHPSHSLVVALVWLLVRRRRRGR